MNNNDILIRLRYALDIKDIDMMEIFKLGGITLAKEELTRMLLKPRNASSNGSDEDEFIANEDMKKCNNYMLESFLNGFYYFQERKPRNKTKRTRKASIFNKR